MSQAPGGAGRSPLAEQLSQSCIGLRSEIEATRHLFRGQPKYVLRDPLTFDSHAFTERNYKILSFLRSDRPLGDVFNDLVERKIVRAEDEESFYRFILDLHRRNLLKLPISDEKTSYDRYERREAGKKMALAMSIFSARRSLCDPDAFLQRTRHWVRPLFTRWAFAIWLLVVGAGVVLLGLEWNELGAPLDQVLMASNLPALWITLILLKVVHELGHAYACKLQGGHVPEIGINFILGTPLPYVDASAAWSFPRKLDRIIVSVAGMYVELFIAAVALICWSLMEPSMLRSIAYNTAFMASVVTLAFNLNPLMRFDGYYILSDLVEVPNLRARASEACNNFFKRVLLGLHWPKIAGETQVLRTILVGFGFASVIYRITLVLGISSMIAQQYMVAGLALGASYMAMEVFRGIRGLIKLLFFSEQMQSLKLRAGLAAVFVFMALPAGVAYIPVPARVVAPGLYAAEGEDVYRAQRGGFLREIDIVASQWVDRRTRLVQLEDLDAEAALIDSERDAKVAELQVRAAFEGEPGGLREAEQRALVQQRALELQNADIAELSVHAERRGMVLECLDADDLGRWVSVHEPIATVVYGHQQVRCLLTERQLVDARPEPGQRVLFRPASDPSRTYAGHVARVEPAGSRRITEETLTHLAGGGIAVSPVSGEALEPHFLVTVDLALAGKDRSPAGQDALRHGMRGRVLFSGDPMTLGASVLRRVQLFIGRIRTSA